MTEEETHELIRKAFVDAHPHFQANSDVVRFCLYMQVRCVHICRMIMGDEDTLKALDALMIDAKRPLPPEAYQGDKP